MSYIFHHLVCPRCMNDFTHQLCRSACLPNCANALSISMSAIHSLQPSTITSYTFSWCSIYVFHLFLTMYGFTTVSTVTPETVHSNYILPFICQLFCYFEHRSLPFLRIKLLSTFISLPLLRLSNCLVCNLLCHVIFCQCIFLDSSTIIHTLFFSIVSLTLFPTSSFHHHVSMMP